MQHEYQQKEAEKVYSERRRRHTEGYFIISKDGKPKEVSMFSWCKQKADLHR